jgi:hypothetical protein
MMTEETRRVMRARRVAPWGFMEMRPIIPTEIIEPNRNTPVAVISLDNGFERRCHLATQHDILIKPPIHIITPSSKIECRIAPSRPMPNPTPMRRHKFVSERLFDEYATPARITETNHNSNRPAIRYGITVAAITRTIPAAKAKPLVKSRENGDSEGRRIIIPPAAKAITAKLVRIMTATPINKPMNKARIGAISELNSNRSAADRGTKQRIFVMSSGSNKEITVVDTSAAATAESVFRVIE